LKAVVIAQKTRISSLFILDRNKKILTENFFEKTEYNYQEAKSAYFKKIVTSLTSKEVETKQEGNI